MCQDLKDGGYKLYEKSDYRLIQLGNIWLKKENNKDESFCVQDEDWFDYHGIEKALCGKEDYDYWTTKRILVIQMA